VRGPLTILKEKWVCENTVISILDYMECFRHQLTIACAIEQDSLKQSQDKMKQWYDKDAMIGQSKPGEKIIVLLLIPCHPLQANYFWSYVIESRMNDLNYIVNTYTPLKNKINSYSLNYSFNIPKWNEFRWRDILLLVNIYFLI
jgi:hypothetical protein